MSTESDFGCYWLPAADAGAPKRGAKEFPILDPDGHGEILGTLA
jgi:hypothetical protein